MCTVEKINARKYIFYFLLVLNVSVSDCAPWVEGKRLRFTHNYQRNNVRSVPKDKGSCMFEFERLKDGGLMWPLGS